MPKSDPPTHPILLFKASPQMEQVLKSLICTLELERGKRELSARKAKRKIPRTDGEEARRVRSRSERGKIGFSLGERIERRVLPSRP